jgi:UTP:GlnB (protein PII) uridylyltransferase
VAEVTCTGRPRGLHLLTVSAPDQTGLLSAICRAVAEQSVSIEVAHAANRHGRAEDLFLVDGEVDVAELASRLSTSGRSGAARLALDLVSHIPGLGGLAGRSLDKVI